MSNSSLSINQPAIKSRLIQHSDYNYTLEIQPLLPGFGYTLGNSLRRILLSSVPGFAVTRIKINDISHEYQPIEGVSEDALEVVLNLKSIRARINTGEDKVTLTLHKKGPGKVTAADFKTEKNCEIINKDLYICSLDKEGELNIEVDISRGIGYLSIEKISLTDNINPQNILVDALFSPVTNVKMDVEDIRVGEATNFNSLKLSFTTDGTVEAKDIVSYTMDVIIDMFNKTRSSFEASLEEGVLMEPEANNDEEEGIVKVVESDEITISSKKIMSILAKNDISTNSQLKERQNDLESLAGIDEKMIETINKYLQELE
jgi:DNA-directed RNA polymerase subunit alpha